MSFMRTKSWPQKKDITSDQQEKKKHKISKSLKRIKTWQKMNLVAQEEGSILIHLNFF
jgi:hypothetical protein